MKTKYVLGLASLLGVLVASTAFAYQVTGPVIELNDKKIVVQKGKEKWEIARDPSTKVNGDLKIGSRVTVQYTMAASDIEVKEGGAKKKGK